MNNNVALSELPTGALIALGVYVVFREAGILSRQRQQDERGKHAAGGKNAIHWNDKTKDGK